jgi:hypothetical protein
MKRSMLILPLVAALAVTGCKKEAAGPKSMDEVKAEAAKLPKPQPGLYRSTSRLTTFEAPGLPSQMAERIKAMFTTQSVGKEFCLTAKEAEKGYEESVKKMAGQGNCVFDRYETDGSKLDAQLTCTTEKDGKGGKGVFGMKGNMMPTGSMMTVSIDQSNPQMPDKSMHMVAEVKSERVGDCNS